MVSKSSGSSLNLPSSLRCWSCGFPMIKMGTVTWWCRDCEVWEAPGQPNRVHALKSAIFEGEVIVYVDHSKVNMPSPA